MATEVITVEHLLALQERTGEPVAFVVVNDSRWAVGRGYVTCDGERINASWIASDSEAARQWCASKQARTLTAVSACLSVRRAVTQ